jgi:hypothetical protein
MSALTLPQFHLVQKMLRSQVRHCEIARATGLSVWTISRIAGDLRRGDTNPTHQRGSAASPRDLEGVGSQLQQPIIQLEEVSPQLTECPFSPDLPEDDAPPDYVATNLRRCQGCGGMVYQWPCLTCQLRARPQPRS